LGVFLDLSSTPQASNAAPQPLPNAEARNERTLEAVGCRRLFGQATENFLNSLVQLFTRMVRQEKLFALLQPQHYAEKPVYFCLQLRTEPPKTTDNDRLFHRRQFVHP
jgi:hypothetical protein